VSVFFKSAMAAALLCTVSCTLVTFDKESVSCSLSESQTWFSGDCIQFCFSSEPDRSQAEQDISLQSDSKPVEIRFNWNGSTLSVCPSAAWNKGKLYRITFDGSVSIKNSSVQVSILRSFTYGNSEDAFCVDNESAVTLPDTCASPLSFSFNRALDETSFLDNFSLSPSCSTVITFTGNKTKAVITPSERWELNTIYRWTLQNIQTADGYYLQKPVSGIFTAVSDTELPELLEVCAVSDTSTDADWLTGRGLDNVIREKQPVGFIFSKSMDIDSVTNGITFSPSISGYMKVVNDACTQFIYIPDTEYRIKQKYTLTAAASIYDKNMLTLYKKYTYTFTPASEYLTVTSMTVNGTSVSLPDEEAIPCTISKNPEDAYELTIKCGFSSEINKEQRKAAADCAGLSLLFPLTSVSPVQIKSSWNNTGTILTLTWENFTPSTASVRTYYSFKLTGGNGGLTNGRGEYMEKDVCVTIEPKE
jgi:hypothetical protein